MQNITYSQPTSRKFWSTKVVYLFLAIVGAIASWSLLIPFFIQNHFSISLFLQDGFTNVVSSATAADLLLSALIFFCFSFLELKRLGISQRWLLVYIVITFSIGLSCALPLFFYFREQALEISRLKA